MSSFLIKQDTDTLSMQLDLICRHDESAEEARQYISNIYRDTYQATITPNPDIIIVGKDKISSAFVACSGMSFTNPSYSKQLFSERYLPSPLNEIIFSKAGVPVLNQQVVEIGSLASDNPNAAANLIRIIPMIAWLMGSKAILCTATRRLRKLLKFHNIPFTILAKASADYLSEQEYAAWGSYYDQDPQTGVIILENCGHLFNQFCGRMIFSEFKHLPCSVLHQEQEAA